MSYDYLEVTVLDSLNPNIEFVYTSLETFTSAGVASHENVLSYDISIPNSNTLAFTLSKASNDEEDEDGISGASQLQMSGLLLAGAACQRSSKAVCLSAIAGMNRYLSIFQHLMYPNY